MKMKEETQEVPDSARSKWGEKDGAGDLLRNVELEQTASQMDGKYHF